MAFSVQVLDNEISVSYTEIGDEKSPTEGANKEGPRATRLLECTWANRWTLLKELLGWWEYNSNTDTVVIHRPHDYPHNQWAKCLDVNILPFGKDVPSGVDGVSAYGKARLTVVYGVPEEDDYASESLEPSAEFLTFPNEKLFWDAAKTEPLNEDEAPGVLLNTLNWIYNRHKMPYIPVEILNLIGYVNAAAITSPTLGMTFPIETLLYQPPTLAREISVVGGDYARLTGWRIEFRFTYRPTGWNKFPKRGEAFTFKDIYDDSGTLKKVYPLGDFTPLFWNL